MTFPEPTPDEIIEALENTGFLLEQTAAKAIAAAGFSTVVGKAFKDPDEGKSREIDCVGYRLVAQSEEQRWFVSSRVAVECKNVKHPYVVVGRSPAPRDLSRAPAEAWFTAPKLTQPLTDGRDGYIELPRWRGMLLDDLPNNPYRTDSSAVNCCDCSYNTRLGRPITMASSTRLSSRWQRRFAHCKRRTGGLRESYGWVWISFICR
jgi:hypothetical protein